MCGLESADDSRNGLWAVWPVFAVFTRLMYSYYTCLCIKIPETYIPGLCLQLASRIRPGGWPGPHLSPERKPRTKRNRRRNASPGIGRCGCLGSVNMRVWTQAWLLVLKPTGYDGPVLLLPGHWATRPIHKHPDGPWQPGPRHLNPGHGSSKGH